MLLLGINLHCKKVKERANCPDDDEHLGQEWSHDQILLSVEKCLEDSISDDCRMQTRGSGGVHATVLATITAEGVQ